MTAPYQLQRDADLRPLNTFGVHARAPWLLQVDEPSALAEALRRLVALHGAPKVWAQIVKRAMAQPVGWEASAAAYADLYESILR